ncbi:MAG TPA: hypothetical protein EYP34_06815 [Chromatiaceae bacterium]|nr:hypothetical protein [Chromatiaceae bacterium]
MRPILSHFLITTMLCLLPLQQAQAFFCFKFAMGGKTSRHPPRYLPHSASAYAVPHPSYFLSQPRYAPYLPYSARGANEAIDHPSPPTARIPTP